MYIESEKIYCINSLDHIKRSAETQSDIYIGSFLLLGGAFIGNHTIQCILQSLSSGSIGSFFSLSSIR